MEKIYSAFLILTHVILAAVVCGTADEVNITSGCISWERNTLLKFKASLSDPSGRLSSWNTSIDCCDWQGVECDNISRHVIGLDLQNQRYGHGDDYVYPSPTNMLHSKTLHSFILYLKHLSFLDLSGNDFHLSSIPPFLGSMNQIQHLNLSHANFGGVVPHHLGNLSSLSVLDLSHNGFHQLIVDDFTWLSRLSSLKHLNMSTVDLSRTKDLLKVLNMLHIVVDLWMSSSRLTNQNLKHACVDSALTHVEYLDLSNNWFHGEIPCFLENMTSLRYMFLSHNSYTSCGQLHLAKSTNLVELSLSYNSLYCSADSVSEFILDKPHLKDLSIYNNYCNGDVSKIILSLSGYPDPKLEWLDLSRNNFYGRLPKEIGGLRKLRVLWLDNNLMSGPIPASIGNLSALEHMSLQFNQLSGEIPTSIGNLSVLKRLYLGHNQLSGNIPISLGQLSNLEYFSLNYLNGTISESHFVTLSKLRELTISNNAINFSMRSSWMPPFQLKWLDMESCEIVGGEFPQWLRSQKELQLLYMNNFSISGTLSMLLPHINMAFLDLSNNSIDGALPDSLCQMKHLQFLDLSRNSLSGNLPDCWVNLTMLVVLSVSSNRLSGVIPDSIGGAYSLRGLHLSRNRFTGELPLTLRNCTQLKILDIGENSMSGKVPEWIGNYLLNLKVLRLSSNKFCGTISSQLCQLSELQIMDLANNMLTGTIPHCFGNFTYMVTYNSTVESFASNNLQLMIKGAAVVYFSTLKYVVYVDLSKNSLVGEIPEEVTRLASLHFLNLSHNHLQGNIPQRVGDMNSLESLDLSNNNLTGNIPRSLTDLNFLSHMNLSCNNLTGEIPTGRQLQTLEDPSIYKGNPGLCGAPLPGKCDEDKASNSSNDENHVAEDEDDKAERIWFYGIVTTGFATGFWGAIGVLVFKSGWRYAYFKFTDGIITRIMGA